MRQQQRAHGERDGAPPGLRVLNLDDNQIARYARSESLRHAGFKVLEASTGGDALRMLDGDDVDVAVLDVKLPDMSGLEVTRRMKADSATRSIKIVQISAAYLDERDEVSSLSHGADVYLRSPAEIDALTNVVETLGRLRRAEILLARHALPPQPNREVIGAAQFDLAGYVTAINGDYCDLLKRASQDLCLLQLDQLVYSADADRVMGLFRDMVHGDGRDFRVEMRQVAGDGAVLQLHCSFSVMRSISGVARGVLCSVVASTPAWRLR